MRRLAAAFLLLATAGASGPSPSDTLKAVRVLDQKVASIGHKLAVARPDLCALPQWRPGFTLHNLSQYAPDYREVAQRLFALRDAPAVLAVAADGPAQQAGLRPDDVVVAADGMPMPLAGNEMHATDTLEAGQKIIERAFADGRAVLDISRNGSAQRIDIEASPGCASRFQLLPSGDMNARADGTYVQVTTAVAVYAQDDAELAAMLAHEFAHNALQHRDVINNSGRAGGIFAPFSGRKRLTRRTEEEADRLSIYFLDAAGYPPQAAIRFWQRFGPDREPLLRSGSHPSWRRRVAILEEEIGALDRQKASGLQPVPSFMRGRR